MNKYDSERISGILESLGSVPVPTPQEADFVIFLTCCVRDSADTRAYGRISSLKDMALRKDSVFDKRYICVGGCVGQRDGASLQDAIPIIDVVFGTQNISRLPALIANAVSSHSKAVEILEDYDGFSESSRLSRQNPWSAWLPISVGCDNFCTYCVVPYVRGRERSYPLEMIVSDAQRYVDDGVKEITLLGQNVNSYGRDLYGEPAFARVLEKVSATGIDRIRFTTSHPKDLTWDVMREFSCLPNLMPALHLPLQSGSDSVLHDMNRHYSASRYLQLVEELRSICPDIALSTDVIVGFPTETEKDFQDTYDIVERIGFNQVFTFIYSPRAGTRAAEMRRTFSRAEIQDRFDRLIELVQRCAYSANQADVGQTVDVLIEGASKRDPSKLSGRSPKNQTVHAPLPSGKAVQDFVGRIIPIRISEAKTWYLKGSLVDAEH